MDKAISSIKALLKANSPLSHDEIRAQLKLNETLCLDALRWLLDSGHIKNVEHQLYAIKS